MPAKDLGSKHACYKCGTKFYDLKKPVPMCPKCGADQRESPALKAPSLPEKRSKAPARLPVEPKLEEVEGAELEEDLEDEDEPGEAEGDEV
jgi:uncharacterized protein (TIGR02300 family)